MLFAYKPIPGGEKNSAAGIEEKDAGGDLLWSVYSNLSGGSFAPPRAACYQYSIGGQNDRRSRFYNLI